MTYSIDVSQPRRGAGEQRRRVRRSLDPAWAPTPASSRRSTAASSACRRPAHRPRIDWPPIATLAGNGAECARCASRRPSRSPSPTRPTVLNTATATSIEEPAGVELEPDRPAGLRAGHRARARRSPPTPADYAVGEIIQWTITAQNTGGCAATGIEVERLIDVARLDEATLTSQPRPGPTTPVTNT